MASHQGTSDVVLDESGGEFVNWKKKYLKMRQKYKDLGGSSDEESSDDDDDQHPAKKRRLNEKPSMDPLVKLGQDCFDEVLKWFTLKELLDSKLVSKSWKSFIESKASVTKKIVVKLTSEKVKRMSLKTLDQILDSEPNYKHMATDFTISVKSFRFPFKSCAATLETLLIKSVTWELGSFVPPACEFVKLKKLMCDGLCTPLLNFIERSSFPQLTHLRISKFNNRKRLDTFLMKFPLLRVILFLPHNNRSGNVHWVPKFKKKIKNLPKIEAISIDRYYTALFDVFKDTLTEVCLEGISDSELRELLGTLKALQSLSISWIQTTVSAPLPRHENLQTLRIISTHSDNGIFRELLLASPSLSSLIIGWISGTWNNEFIHFLASNMKNLAEVSCQSVPPTAIEFYDGLKASRDINLNTRFLLTVSTAGYQYSALTTAFNERHFKQSN